MARSAGRSSASSCSPTTLPRRTSRGHRTTTPRRPPAPARPATRPASRCRPAGTGARPARIRRYTDEVAQKLTPQILQTNGNEHDIRGGGGSCFGDSGGPSFKNGYVVTVTSYGYTSGCRYLGGLQRVDNPGVQDWAGRLRGRPGELTGKRHSSADRRGQGAGAKNAGMLAAAGPAGQTRSWSALSVHHWDSTTGPSWKDASEQRPSATAFERGPAVCHSGRPQETRPTMSVHCSDVE